MNDVYFDNFCPLTTFMEKQKLIDQIDQYLSQMSNRELQEVLEFVKDTGWKTYTDITRAGIIETDGYEGLLDIQKEKEARQLCKERGFRVKRLLDWSDDEFLFLCARGKIVAVVNGRVIPAPGRKNLIQVMQIICKKPRVKGQARRG